MSAVAFLFLNPYSHVVCFFVFHIHKFLVKHKVGFKSNAATLEMILTHCDSFLGSSYVWWHLDLK